MSKNHTSEEAPLIAVIGVFSSNDCRLFTVSYQQALCQNEILCQRSLTIGDELPPKKTCPGSLPGASLSAPRRLAVREGRVKELPEYFELEFDDVLLPASGAEKHDPSCRFGQFTPNRLTEVSLQMTGCKRTKLGCWVECMVWPQRSNSDGVLQDQAVRKASQPTLHNGYDPGQVS